MSNLLNVSHFLGEITVNGILTTLYQYSKRKYFLVLTKPDGTNETLEFASRKAVDNYLSTM